MLNIKKILAIILIVVVILNLLLVAMGKISYTIFWIVLLIGFIITLFYRK